LILQRLSAAFNQADSLVMVANDKSDESNLYGKSLALQLWLLGYEMPGTVFVFAKNQIFVLASAKKKALLAQLGSTGLGCELQVLTVNKEDKNATNFAQLLDTLRSAGRKVGLSTYKNVEGEQATAFLAALQADSNLETADVTAGLAETWAVKDEKELKHAAKAAELSADIFKLAVSKVEDVIDGDLKISHGKLTEDIEKVFQDPVAFKIKARPDNLESCYSPIFMSGGRYDLRASATSDDANLHQGVIVIELGARYKSYCSNMARTLFIDPTEEQKETYKILLKVYQAITQTLRNNVPLSKVWEAAITVIKTEKESLLPHFTKNCGFATGLEFREAALLINEKCAAKARTNMVFNVCIGFSDVARTSPGGDAKTSTFAVMVADTVVVTDDVCEVLTHYPRKMGELSYSLGDGNDEGEKQESGDEDDAEDSADAKKKKQELAELMAQNPEAFRRKTRSQDEAIAAKNRELVPTFS
jgi:nucleosome binding factor SPN SPT16 subunit